MTARTLFTEHPAIKEFHDLIAKDALAAGRADEARAFLLRQGRKRFGPPRPEHEAALEQESDLARLEALGERLLDVTTWDALFAPAE
jgi:hypothetical protein